MTTALLIDIHPVAIFDTARHTIRKPRPAGGKPSHRAHPAGVVTKEGFVRTLFYPNPTSGVDPLGKARSGTFVYPRVPDPRSGRDGRRVLTGRAGLGVLAGVRGEEPRGGGSGWCVAAVIVSSRAAAVVFRNARRARAPRAPPLAEDARTRPARGSRSGRPHVSAARPPSPSPDPHDTDPHTTRTCPAIRDALTFVSTPLRALFFSPPSNSRHHLRRGVRRVWRAPRDRRSRRTRGALRANPAE